MGAVFKASTWCLPSCAYSVTYLFTEVAYIKAIAIN